MPFPLAHPAAVLPLRRWCPGWFDFSALVIGSMGPDLAYLSGPLHVHDFSHTFAGTFGFSLPVGFVAWWLVRRFGARLAALVPVAKGLQFPQPTRLDARRLAIAALSLLVGAWSHVLWDSFTHKEGWMVGQLPVLRVPVGWALGHQIKVFQLLWYGSTFIGVASLYVVFEMWQWKKQGATTLSAGSTLLRAAALATLAVMLGVIHHLFRAWQMLFLVGFAAVILVLVFAVWLGRPKRLEE